MKLKKPNHYGVVVNDLEEAKERYSKLLGIKKWYRIVCDNLDLYYLDEKRNCEVVLYVGGKGSTKVELIQTRGDSNIYTAMLETRGEGLHHIMYNVKNLDVAVADFANNGYKVLQKASFNSAGSKIRYAYVGKNETDTVFELVETTIMMGIKKGDMPFEIQLGVLTGSYKRV